MIVPCEDLTKWLETFTSENSIYPHKTIEAEDFAVVVVLRGTDGRINIIYDQVHVWFKGQTHVFQFDWTTVYRSLGARVSGSKVTVRLLMSSGPEVHHYASIDFAKLGN